MQVTFKTLILQVELYYNTLLVSNFSIDTFTGCMIPYKSNRTNSTHILLMYHHTLRKIIQEVIYNYYSVIFIIYVIQCKSHHVDATHFLLMCHYAPCKIIHGIIEISPLTYL